MSEADEQEITNGGFMPWLLTPAPTHDAHINAHKYCFKRDISYIGNWQVLDVIQDQTCSIAENLETLCLFIQNAKCKNDACGSF